MNWRKEKHPASENPSYAKSKAGKKEDLMNCQISITGLVRNKQDSCLIMYVIHREDPAKKFLKHYKIQDKFRV